MTMRTIRSHRDLEVWQVAMSVAEQCYRLTQSFPREEMFGLTLQIRRAAASVPANIAEGYGRESKREYIQFLRIAPRFTKGVGNIFAACSPRRISI
jgi:hypothetical protein